MHPAGRNSVADARLLWKNWRVGLLKDVVPGNAVLLSHGHPEQHWKRDGYGALCIDLESMWDDFEYAVLQFVSALRTNEADAETVLARYRERTWTVPSVTHPDR